jgi:hypothetical protein
MLFKFVAGIWYRNLHQYQKEESSQLTFTDVASLIWVVGGLKSLVLLDFFIWIYNILQH